LLVLGLLLFSIFGFLDVSSSSSSCFLFFDLLRLFFILLASALTLLVEFLLLVNDLVLVLRGSSLDLLDGLSEVVVDTIFSFPVTIIGKQVEPIISAFSTLSNVRSEVATQGSREDRDNKSDTEGTQLDPALLTDGTLVSRESLESRYEFTFVILKSQLSKSSGDSSDDSSENSR